MGLIDMNWEPIDTAPKDGTEILAWDRMVLRVAWQNPWDDGNEGWHLGQFLMFGNETTHCQPTHWMPLPKGPKE